MNELIGEFRKSDSSLVALIVAGVTMELLYLILYAIFGIYYADLISAFKNSFSFPYLEVIVNLFKGKPQFKGILAPALLYLLVIPYLVAAFISVRRYFKTGKWKWGLVSWAGASVIAVAVLLFALPKTTSFLAMTLAYNFIVIALLSLYLIALKAISRDDSKTTAKIIVLFAIVFSVTLLFLPPFRSCDIFSYISHGKTVELYEDNPYFHTPSYFSEDPVLAYIDTWQRITSVYGPVWISTVAFLISLAGENLGKEIFVFKLGMILLIFFSGFLIYKISEKGGWRNSNAALLLFLWSPLLMVDIAGNAHNDIMMIALFLLGYLAYLYHRKLFAAISFTMAALTKIVSLPVLLIFSVYAITRESEMRNRFETLCGFSFAVISVAFISYFPYWLGPIVFGSLMKGLKFYYSSPLRLVFLSARGILIAFFGFMPETAFSVTNFLIKVPTMAILLFVFVLALKKFDGVKKLPTAFLLALFGYILLSTYYMPWYSLWLIAFIPFCEDKVLFISALSLTLTSLIITPLFGFKTIASEIVAIFLIFTIPIALLVAGKLLKREWVTALAEKIWQFE